MHNILCAVQAMTVLSCSHEQQ